VVWHHRRLHRHPLPRLQRTPPPTQYLAALTNNVAINIKVGLENLFMRAIFFLDHK
jgi:hypothetical protein